MNAQVSCDEPSLSGRSVIFSWKNNRGFHIQGLQPKQLYHMVRYADEEVHCFLEVVTRILEREVSLNCSSSVPIRYSVSLSMSFLSLLHFYTFEPNGL